MTYDVILLTNSPLTDGYTRSYGAYRLASELRGHGYTVLVINHSEMLNLSTFQDIMSLAVGKNTLCVGFSVSWFISTTGKGDYNEYELDYPDGDIWNLKKENITSLIDNSVMYHFSQQNADTVIDIIKNINPNIKIAVGGTTAYSYISKLDKIDNIFIGFSENQFISYIDSLAKKNDKTFDKIVDIDPLGKIGNFDFRNSVVTYDESDFIQKNEVLLIEFTRGCIFNCSFCNYPHRNQKTKNFIKYKESIKKELLENYNKWGTTRYVIVDDTFNDHTEKLELILEVVKELPFKPKFWAYCRLDLFDAHPEQAQLMKDIGVTEILYGLETWNENTAKIIKKGNSNLKKINGMKIAKEAWGDDVTITVTMVVGLPEDTIESWHDFLNFVKIEGYKYINEFAPASLLLRSDDGYNQYRLKTNHLSEIEKNFEKYGYSFPYADIGKTTHWIRNDNGDINSFDKANEIADYVNQELNLYYSKNIDNFDRITHYDDMIEKLNINREHFEMDKMLVFWFIVHEWCNKYYYPFLLNYIRNS